MTKLWFSRIHRNCKSEKKELRKLNVVPLFFNFLDPLLVKLRSSNLLHVVDYCVHFRIFRRYINIIYRPTCFLTNLSALESRIPYFLNQTVECRVARRVTITLEVLRTILHTALFQTITTDFRTDFILVNSSNTGTPYWYEWNASMDLHNRDIK